MPFQLEKKNKKLLGQNEIPILIIGQLRVEIVDADMLANIKRTKMVGNFRIMTDMKHIFYVDPTQRHIVLLISKDKEWPAFLEEVWSELREEVLSLYLCHYIPIYNSHFCYRNLRTLLQSSTVVWAMNF